MIEAQLSTAALFKKIVDALKDVVPEINFDCSDSGISVQAMDSSHVALTALSIPTSGFGHYRCDRSHNFGVSLTSLSKILRSASNDPILFKKDESKDILQLSFKCADTGKVVEYEIKVMDIDSEHLSIPETEYEVVVKMPSVELLRVCRDLAQLTDSVTISIDKDEIQFKATGNFASGGIKISSSSSDSDEKSSSCTINASRKVSLCLSLPYLNNFTKATPLCDTVTISASEDQPIMIEYKLETAGYIKYYLAPKIGS